MADKIDKNLSLRGAYSRPTGPWKLRFKLTLKKCIQNAFREFLQRGSNLLRGLFLSQAREGPLSSGPLRSYRKQDVGNGSLTINKYIGCRFCFLLLRSRCREIFAAIEASVVCLGLGQVQSTAELLAIAPTGILSYAQPSALLTHGFRQRPGVGCFPPATADKEAKRG